MPDSSSASKRLPIQSDVFRSLKPGWVDSDGNVQAVAYKRRRKHPVTKKPELGISVGIKALQTAEVFQNKQYGRAVGEIRVGSICDVRKDLCNLYVKQVGRDPSHAEIRGVPFWDTEDDDGYLVADDLADLTLVVLPEQLKQ